MEESSIVIMLKDEKTGFLTKELASIKIIENEEYIVNIYAVKKLNDYIAHIKISTNREVENWEFDAIYDYYDEEIIMPSVNSFAEVSECFLPTWEITLDFASNEIDSFTDKLSKILRIHVLELNDVFKEIVGKKHDYLD